MIIDAHAHFAEQSVAVLDPSLERCLATMDRLGIDCMIQSFGKALGHGRYSDFERYTEESCELYEKSGKRIYSYFFYNPHMSDFCVRMIEDNTDLPAFVGIKLHPAINNVFADDEAYRPAYESARKFGLPVLSHTWALTSNPSQKYAVPELFEKYIREFPDVSFIFGHSGGRVNGIREALEIGKRYKNAFYDLAGDIYDRGLVEYIAGGVGAERLLFGSDLCWFDPAAQMGMILGANLTTEEKALILGGNAARLFRIP